MAELEFRMEVSSVPVAPLSDAIFDSVISAARLLSATKSTSICVAHVMRVED